MPCRSAAKPVLSLMAQIVAGQRWGLGAAKAGAKFKGGWGPGSSPGAAGPFVERQLGIITLRGRPFAVAIPTAPADGSS